MLWSYSKLDESTVKAIEELEKKLNVTLLAFQARTSRMPTYHLMH